jgi:hypothetical protein
MPDYKRIYSDIIDKKFPDRKQEYFYFLEKDSLSILDIIKLNQKIFGTSNKQNLAFNQMHRAYDEEAIIEILNYQKNNNMNNSQLAVHFKLSRSTVTKWRKNFLEVI